MTRVRVAARQLADLPGPGEWGIFTPGHNAFGWITSNDMDVAWSH